MQADTRTTILGISFDSLTLDQVIQRVRQSIEKRSWCHIVTPGPEFVMRAQYDAAFRSVLKNAEISLPDGMGIVFAAKVLGLPPLTRITGNDLMQGVFAEAARRQWRIYLYGTLREGVMSRAATEAVSQYPRLQVVGADSGFRRWLKVPDAVVCWRIRRSNADILFVALGAPEQDIWIAHNGHRLGTVTVAAGIGGAIDYLSGALPRAPQFMRSLGLEWLVRLFVQPRRRWKRIVTAVIRFPAAILREKLRGGSHA